MGIIHNAQPEDKLATIIQALSSGGIAVVRTDTVYGIIAVASNETAVQKVYDAKKRSPEKQCITLVTSSPEDSTYGAIVEEYSEKAHSPTTIIVPASNEPSWVLRGGDSVAYRIVTDKFIKAVIDAVGPVIAPSANPEGLPTARTVEEAKKYFGDAVDCYIDGGEVPEVTQPSDIIKINSDNTLEIVRSATQSNNSQTPKKVKTQRSSGGVLIKDNKVLLIHWAHPRDSYDFPKGAIEEGETSEQACTREVFEETGYKTRIISYIGSNEFDFQNHEDEWRHKICDYYLLELIDERLYETARELHETFENVWVPINEAEQIITRDINIDIFKKAVIY